MITQVLPEMLDARGDTRKELIEGWIVVSVMELNPEYQRYVHMRPPKNSVAQELFDYSGNVDVVHIIPRHGATIMGRPDEFLVEH